MIQYTVLSDGERFAHTVFQNEARLFNYEINLFGFGNADFRIVIVGQYEDHFVVSFPDFLEERIALGSGCFYGLAVGSGDSLAVYGPVTFRIDIQFGRNPVFTRYGNLISRCVGKPFALTTDRPIVDAFEKVDADNRSVRTFLTVFDRDGIATTECNGVPVVGFCDFRDEFIRIDGIDDGL